MPDVTPDQVARALAPMIRLHSQDPHQPASVDWFLGRCQLASGSGTLSSGGAGLPAGMTVLSAGPMTGDSLAAASSSTTFGGGEIDNISLFPLTSVPGGVPAADWTWISLLQGYFVNIGELLPDPPSVPVSDPHFYNYQLETFLGQSVRAGTRTTRPIYCRIATRLDYYLISYFGFFSYNGGLGPQSSFTSRPLGVRSGFGAHIGDWVRLTAKVKIAGDLVSLLYVDYEAHGDPNILTSSNFSNLPLAQVPRLVAYAAWHSHEMYPDAGVHPRPATVFTANDYTDDVGVLWDTAQNLVFVSDDGPSWIRYNGLWGANMYVPGTLADYLKNGPQGPAFHWYWVSETKDGGSPIQQWRPPTQGPLPAPTGLAWNPAPPQDSIYSGNQFQLSWNQVSGATSYLVSTTRDGFPFATSSQTAPPFNYSIAQADMYHVFGATVMALGPDRPLGATAVAPSFYCGNATG